MRATIDAVIKKLRDVIPRAKVKNYYHGDILIIPESSMPAIIVDGVSTEIEIRDTAKDTHLHRIRIKFVDKAKKDFMKKPGKEALKPLIEDLFTEKDSSGNLKTNNIVYLLRHGMQIDTNKQIAGGASIVYDGRGAGIGLRGEIITREAYIEINVREILTR